MQDYVDRIQREMDAQDMPPTVESAVEVAEELFLDELDAEEYDALLQEIENTDRWTIHPGLNPRSAGPETTTESEREEEGFHDIAPGNPEL